MLREMPEAHHADLWNKGIPTLQKGQLNLIVKARNCDIPAVSRSVLQQLRCLSSLSGI